MSTAPDCRTCTSVGLDVAVDAQLADSEELDDAILHLVEAVVIGVEHGACLVEVELIVGARVPRQLEDAIEPCADPRVLR